MRLTIPSTVAGVLLLAALPAHATFIHEIFDTDDNQIGTLEFATASGEETQFLNSVLQANFTLAGVTFTDSEAWFASWSDADSSGLNAWVQWQHLNSDPTPSVIYSVALHFSDGIYAGASSFKTPGCTSQQCLSEYDTVFGALTDIARASRLPVPEPSALALMAAGLLGIGVARKKKA